MQQFLFLSTVIMKFENGVLFVGKVWTCRISLQDGFKFKDTSFVDDLIKN